VTFPAGVLAASTQIAIDVFTSPLSLQTPSGYIGPGTRFVNIDLTPQPAFPLPSPGLTVTLPLLSPSPPGDRIDLFRVDTATGTLVPALDTSGLPVVGTVAADGLTATFFGVSRLSVVTGLVPEVLRVAIDIKPGPGLAAFEPQSQGLTPVAILSTASFDAPSAIRRESLTFGRTGDEVSLSFCNSRGEDVNGDSRLDLVCHFYTNRTGFQTGDGVGVLKGKTVRNLKIVGSEAVRILR
jgi:hypothetical protein